ncbi:MAG TPA: hypothetical protein VMZ91_06475 [Candidatus Paceibacterota bacterium]|nr:hypothetical protein [Candidatus Paceibacterota bacterium]
MFEKLKLTEIEENEILKQAEWDLEYNDHWLEHCWIFPTNEETYQKEIEMAKERKIKPYKPYPGESK